MNCKDETPTSREPTMKHSGSASSSRLVAEKEKQLNKLIDDMVTETNEKEGTCTHLLSPEPKNHNQTNHQNHQNHHNHQRSHKSNAHAHNQSEQTTPTANKSTNSNNNNNNESASFTFQRNETENDVECGGFTATESPSQQRKFASSSRKRRVSTVSNSSNHWRRLQTSAALSSHSHHSIRRTAAAATSGKRETTPIWSMATASSKKTSLPRHVRHLENFLSMLFEPMLSGVTNAIRRNESQDAVKAEITFIQTEWAHLATIADRIFCYLFFFITIGSCLLIFVQSPHVFSQW